MNNSEGSGTGLGTGSKGYKDEWGAQEGALHHSPAFQAHMSRQDLILSSQFLTNHYLDSPSPSFLPLLPQSILFNHHIQACMPCLFSQAQLVPK